jgi:hypothetical protein
VFPAQGVAFRRSITLPMQELISTFVDPKAPTRDREFYELRLYESVAAREPTYYVHQARARWDRKAGEFAWDEEQVQRFLTRHEAKDWYVEHRLAFTEKGFIYSDVDLY